MLNCNLPCTVLHCHDGSHKHCDCKCHNSHVTLVKIGGKEMEIIGDSSINDGLLKYRKRNSYGIPLIVVSERTS